jgi:phosphatidylinositol 3-kinase
MCRIYIFCREARDPVETTMKKSFSFTPMEQAAGSDDVSPPVARSNSLLDNLVQSNVPAEQTDSKVETVQGAQWGPEKEETSQDLATFLIQRACQNSTLANYFYWYLFYFWLKFCIPNMTLTYLNIEAS